MRSRRSTTRKPGRPTPITEDAEPTFAARPRRGSCSSRSTRRTTSTSRPTGTTRRRSRTSSPPPATSLRGSTNIAAARCGCASGDDRVRRADARARRGEVRQGDRAGDYASRECVERGSRTQLDRPFEIELSVDETAQPTTPAEHYIIADQLAQSGRADSSAWRRGSSAISRRASTTRATSPRSKRRCASTPRSPSGSARTRSRSTRAPTSSRCTRCSPASPSGQFPREDRGHELPRSAPRRRAPRRAVVPRDHRILAAAATIATRRPTTCRRRSARRPGARRSERSRSSSSRSISTAGATCAPGRGFTEPAGRFCTARSGR